jgi:hypothetical protein
MELINKPEPAVVRQDWRFCWVVLTLLRSGLVNLANSQSVFPFKMFAFLLPTTEATPLAFPKP